MLPQPIERTARRLYPLNVGVISSDDSAADRERERCSPDSRAVFINGDTKHNFKRVHPNPLYPTEFARSQPNHFAEIDAPAGSDDTYNDTKRNII